MADLDALEIAQTMGEPVTQGMFFEALTQMRKDFDERHRHIRDDINEGFRVLGDKLDHHEAEDRAVERRVQRIEDRAESHDAEQTKRSGMQSLGIAALLVAVWEIIKHKIIGWN